MTYTAYDVAQQIMNMRNYTEVHVEAFSELPKDVLSAILCLEAEWRHIQDMDTLIELGADPHEKHEEFTVLENFIQGHDGYWICKDRVKEVEEGVKMLSKHGVTREDLSHSWILSKCADIINNSEYLSTFFGTTSTTRVKVYWHLPRSQNIKLMKMTFKDVEDAVKTLPMLTDHKQYIAVIENRDEVTRYLVSKGCGLLEVIPMEDSPGFSDKQKMVSNIVNFVMVNDEYPGLPCEDDE